MEQDDARTRGRVISPAALPPVSRRRIRNLTVIALALLAVLNAADYVTTRILLTHKAVEVNPLSAALLSRGALLWMKFAIIGIVTAIAMRTRPKIGALLIAWLAVGVYTTAVLSNLLSLRIVA